MNGEINKYFHHFTFNRLNLAVANVRENASFTE